MRGPVHTCVVVLLAVIVGFGAAQGPGEGLEEWLDAAEAWEIDMALFNADLAEYRAVNRPVVLDYALMPEDLKSKVQSLSLDAISLLDRTTSNMYAAGVAFQESSTLEDYARYQFTLAAANQLRVGQDMLNGILEVIEVDAFEARKGFFDLWTMFKRSWEMWM